MKGVWFKWEGGGSSGDQLWGVGLRKLLKRTKIEN